MRIEYVVNLGKDGPKVTHRVITGDTDVGGVPGATGPDDGGVPGATGPDDGGVPGATGPDDGGVPGATGPDDGGVPGATGPDDGGSLAAFGGQSVIVFGPTVITGAPRRDPTGGPPALRPIPPIRLIDKVTAREVPEGNLGSQGDVADAFLEAQEQAYWCWAAVGAGVRRTLEPRGKKLKQCQVANAVMNQDPQGISFALEDCCQNPQRSNRPKSLTKTLEALGNLYEATVGGVATFGVIQSEISSDCPVCARIAWDSEGRGVEEGAHFVIIAGWKTENDTQKLTILDPAPGKSGKGKVEPREVIYQDFRDAYMGTGKWVATYFVKGSAE